MMQELSEQEWDASRKGETASPLSYIVFRCGSLTHSWLQAWLCFSSTFSFAVSCFVFIFTWASTTSHLNTLPFLLPVAETINSLNIGGRKLSAPFHRKSRMITSPLALLSTSRLLPYGCVFSSVFMVSSCPPLFPSFHKLPLWLLLLLLTSSKSYVAQNTSCSTFGQSSLTGEGFGKPQNTCGYMLFLYPKLLA